MVKMKIHILFSIAFFVCIHIYSQKAIIIAQNAEDSLFCRQKYPYDFENDSYLYGLGAFETEIEGLNESLYSIVMSTKDSVLSVFPNTKIAISVVVDRNGKARGAVCHNCTDMELSIAKYAYNLLSNYAYIPAKNRGEPVVSFFVFAFAADI